MKWKHILVAIGLSSAAMLVLFLAMPVQEYEKFRATGLDSDDQVCEQYYESCTCIGSLSVAESYPPQYFCDGIEQCSPINRTECR